MRIFDLGAVAWRDRPAEQDSLRDDEAELVLATAWAPASLMPALRTLLTREEQAVADRYGSSEGRDSAILSRAVLRLVLAGHTGLPPDALDIVAARDGKPCLRNPDATGRPLAFNLSHSGDLLLVAIARASIGVDIETILPMPDLAGFARTMLSATEQATLSALPAARRLDHAYRLWVGKEALAKYSGEGLRRDFRDFDLQDRAESDVALTLFSPHGGYAAAVATSPAMTAMRFHRLLRLDDLAAKHA